MKLETTMKQAVCLLLPLGSAPKFLSVTRRSNASLWGLPGGKVDAGEYNLQALLREVHEEVGLSLPAQGLVPLYCDVCRGAGPADTYWVTTYLWVRPAKTLTDPVTLEEGLLMGWLGEPELTDPRTSPFASYNVGVFDAYRKLARP